MNRKYIKAFVLVLMYNAIALAEYIELQDEEQLRNAISTNTSGLVVKFAADWCGVCEKIAQPFKQVLQEPEFAPITAINVNVDAFEDLAQEHNIEGIPTFHYFAPGGMLIGTTVGIQELEHFQDILRTELRTKFNTDKTSFSEAQTIPDIQAKPISKTPDLAIEKTRSNAASTHSVMDIISGFFIAIIKTLRELLEKFINFFRRIF